MTILKTLNTKDSEDSSQGDDGTFCCSLAVIPEVAQFKILNYLSIQQVLNLRLVCSCTKEWVSRYSCPYFAHRLKPFTIKFTFVNELTSFVNLTWTPPFSSYHMNFIVASHTDEGSSLSSWSKIGKRIQRLTVHSYHFCSSDEEYEVYSSLLNLKHLHFENMMSRRFDEPPWLISKHESTMVISNRHGSTEVSQHRMIPYTLLQSLESFSVEVSNQSKYIYDLIMNCPKLKYLSIGKMYPCDTSLYGILEPSADDEPTLKFRKIAEYICWRDQIRKESWDKNLDLTIDMKHMDAGDSSESVKKYLPFFGLAGIHLINVNELFLKSVLELKKTESCERVENILRNVKSVTAISPILRNLKLVNLEELEFKEVEVHSGDWDQEVDLVNLLPFWKNLKHIKASFIPNRSSSYNYFNPDDNDSITAKMRALQKFLLFHPIKRLSVLSLNIVTSIKLDTDIEPSFVVNFPNLQQLSLSCPKWESDDYTYLFLLLATHTNIIEINLFTTVLFSDRTFMGPPANNCIDQDHDQDQDTTPYLLRLKSLRKLKVIYEPGKYISHNNETISDLLFTEVLAAMPLSVFHITGIALVKVSETAKRALWNGSFRRSILDYNIADLGRLF